MLSELVGNLRGLELFEHILQFALGLEVKIYLLHDLKVGLEML